MKKVLLVLLVLGLVASWFAWDKYQDVYAANTAFSENEREFFVPTGSNFEDLEQLLIDQKIVADLESFEWVADQKSFGTAVKPGKYLVEQGTSNNALVNKLRIGRQEPVHLTFNNVRTLKQLAGVFASFVESDSTDFAQVMLSPRTTSRYGFTPEAFPSMFLPNTYEVWWTDGPDEILSRMAQAYKIFWSEERKAQAKKLHLSQSEATTLASIVKAETSKIDEAPKVAGVYLNRLRINMALQADPTLVFAWGDFSITRVLKKHKEIDSPYNTYKYPGLPPGPINIVSQVYIDAVLNAEKHKYLYFCAKPDFSGYHNFSKTYNQHLVHARNYQRELSRRGIYR